jgi:ssDNA-binding Zn-finger/Zn-ribbon topoisomerase 1
VAVRVGDACPACRRGLVQVRYRRNPTRTPFLGCSAFPDCRAVWQIDGTRFPGWDRPGLSARPPSTRNARRVLAFAVLVILAAIVASRILAELLR